MMDNEVTPVVATLNTVVGFHPDHVNCAHCQFCLDAWWNKGAKYCIVTGRIIATETKVDYTCPLVFGDGEEATGFEPENL